MVSECNSWEYFVQPLPWGHNSTPPAIWGPAPHRPKHDPKFEAEKENLKQKKRTEYEKYFFLFLFQNCFAV